MSKQSKRSSSSARAIEKRKTSKSKSNPQVRLSLVVDDEYMDQFADIVARCRAAGMTVEQGLEAIGVVTGFIDAEKADLLQNVKGISSVEQERRYQIAPPDSEIQ